MDPETAIAFGFLGFGLAFFVYMMHFVDRLEDKREERKTRRAQEFGYEGSELAKEAKSYIPKFK